jgi:hypothetical protein
MILFILEKRKTGKYHEQMNLDLLHSPEGTVMLPSVESEQRRSEQCDQDHLAHQYMQDLK